MIISQFCDNSGRRIAQVADFFKKIEKRIAFIPDYLYNKHIYSMRPRKSVYY